MWTALLATVKVKVTVSFPSTLILPRKMWHPLAWSNGCSFGHAHKRAKICFPDLLPLWQPEMMVIAPEQEFKLSSPNILPTKAGEKTRVGEIAKYHPSRKKGSWEAEGKDIIYGEHCRVSKISIVRNLVIFWAILASCIKKKCQSNTEQDCFTSSWCQAAFVRDS